jgi:hypothetical protein
MVMSSSPLLPSPPFHIVPEPPPSSCLPPSPLPPGVKYPLEWIQALRSKSSPGHRWLSLVDAAAFCANNLLDLTMHPADFVDVRGQGGRPGGKKEGGRRRASGCVWIAKGVSSQPASLTPGSSLVRPSVQVAFYKMFGYPTGLGALLVRTEAVESLKKGERWEGGEPGGRGG